MKINEAHLTRYFFNMSQQDLAIRDRHTSKTSLILTQKMSLHISKSRFFTGNDVTRKNVTFSFGILDFVRK